MVIKHNMEVKCVCPVCGKVNYVEVDEESYNKYKNGELIQRALPDIDDDKREMLLSGICPDCWSKIFCDDEEDE